MMPPHGLHEQLTHLKIQADLVLTAGFTQKSPIHGPQPFAGISGTPPRMYRDIFFNYVPNMCSWPPLEKVHSPIFPLTVGLSEWEWWNGIFFLADGHEGWGFRGASV